MVLIKDEGKTYRMDMSDDGALIRGNRKLVRVNEPVANFIEAYILNGFEAGVENIRVKYSLSEDETKSFLLESAELFKINNIFSELTNLITKTCNSKKRILIITPFRKGKLIESVVSNIENFEVVNTTALQLCSFLSKEGYEVDYLSLQNIFRSYNPEKHFHVLEEIISQRRFDFLIFHTDYYMNNTNTASLYSIKIICDCVKSKFPSCPIIYCGKLTEMLDGRLMELVPEIDFAVRGEAEPVILAVLKNYMGIGIQADNRAGGLHRTQNGIVNIPGNSVIEDYNLLPPIDFEYLNKTIEAIEKYVRKIDCLPISIRTSYGCPFSCKFCRNTRDWNNYRTKSKETIDKELKRIALACSGKLKLVFISDEVFTLSEEHIIEMREVFLKNKIKVNGLFSHLNHIDSAKAKLLRDITRSILIGVESWNQSTINNMGKGINLDNLLKKTALIRKNNLAVGIEWIIGLPGMTLENYLQDFNFIYSVIAKNQVDFVEPYIFTPHPNTEIYNSRDKYGIEIRDGFENMLEEGGIPQFEYKEGLCGTQIYLLYLMCKYVIQEAEKAKSHVSEDMLVGEINYRDFKEILDEVEK